MGEGLEWKGIPFCHWTPTEKQREFYEKTEREVFFGGAAGGGKSVALLMGALRYVHTPGYAALIIRKDFARLELAGGLIPRSHEWFGRSGQARWIASRRQWLFEIPGNPGTVPATIMFGYLSRPLDKFRYASSEFQYIAFDELTDFTEEDYLFLFSRLRRNTSLKIPLRMRSASNPGGAGHGWVRARFVDQKFRKEGPLYLPSRICDNPFLDEAEYRESLLHLPPVARERLMNGDWSVQEQGLIEAKWLRYFVQERRQVELIGPDERSIAAIEEGNWRRFVTVDPAGTSEERTREAQGRTASWTVVQVWDQPRGAALAKYLLLRHEVRVRVGFDGLCAVIEKTWSEWKPDKVWIEGEKLGRAAWDVLKKKLTIECLPTGCKDKATRAGPLILKLERGEIFLPRHETTWRVAFEAELLSWTGNEREAADQIDAAAYAVIVAEQRMAGVIRVAMGAAG